MQPCLLLVLLRLYAREIALGAAAAVRKGELKKSTYCTGQGTSRSWHLLRSMCKGAGGRGVLTCAMDAAARHSVSTCANASPTARRAPRIARRRPAGHCSRSRAMSCHWWSNVSLENFQQVMTMPGACRQAYRHAEAIVKVLAVAFRSTNVKCQLLQGMWRQPTWWTWRQGRGGMLSNIAARRRVHGSGLHSNGMLRTPFPPLCICLRV